MRSPSAKDKEADCAKDVASYSKVSYKGATRKMSIIKKYLEDLESRIDSGIEEELLSSWKCFIEGKQDRGLFVPSRRRSSSPAMTWPNVSVNEALDDMDKMMLQQLAACSAVLARGGGTIMNVRSNYGIGILPSVFGAEIFVMDSQLNELPTSRPIGGGADGIKHLLDQGIPDLRNGYGGRCLDMGRNFANQLAGFPKVSEYVRIYHPDLQGPMDVCELLWGSDLFLAMLDTPDLVHASLKLITETYIRFMHEWELIVPPGNQYATHWGILHKGRIALRDDSAMNLSPDMFDEFIRPYNQRLLTEFGGGIIHFCGRGDHYIDRLHDMTGVFAVAMSQPEYNDMECIFRNTVDKGIALVGLPRKAGNAAVSQGRDLHGLVHCW